MFQGSADFRNVQCDGLKLERAEFWQGSVFSGLNFVTDSWITMCEFRELAEFHNCSIWELHFKNNQFLKGLSLLGSSGKGLTRRRAHPLTGAMSGMWCATGA